MARGVAVSDEARPAEQRDGVGELLAAPILVVDGGELTGRDLLAAGIVSGLWQQLERELADGLGLIAEQPPDDSEVAAAVRDFRLEHGLLSAEDLRAWMGKRGLTLAGLKAAARRALARDAGGVPQEVTSAQVSEALPAEAIWTGTLGTVGFWLADRMLSAATTRETPPEPLALESPVVQGLVDEEARSVTGGALSEPDAERAQRLARIAALDEAHRAWQAEVVGPREIARRLHEKEFEWSHFELDELGLASPGAAAEAARQLAEGRDPARVAESAGVPLTARSTVLADAPPELARVLGGAVAGEVVGPWSDDAVFVVGRVRERRRPEIEDEPSAARAREALLTEMVTRLRAGRVRWYERI